MKRTLKALLFFAVLLLVWETLFRARIWSPVLVPSPWSVMRYLWEAAGDGTLMALAGLLGNERVREGQVRKTIAIGAG